MNISQQLQNIEQKIKSGQIQEARTLLEQLIHSDPNNYEIWYWRGVCEKMSGEMELAENDFRSVIRRNPNHDRALYGLGLILESQGNLKEAIEIYQKVISINPSHQQARKKLKTLEVSYPNQGLNNSSNPKVPKVNNYPQTNSFNDNLDKNINRLKHFLEIKEWKKADQETVLIMLKMAGYTDFNFILYRLFSGHRREICLQNIANLSSQDLMIIDQLWNQYSEGRFGFSVQKKIYKNCGGLISPEGVNNLTFDRFIRQVGWHTNVSRKFDAVKGTDHLYYSLASPPGHLPAAWVLSSQDIAYIVEENTGCLSYLGIAFFYLIHATFMCLIFGGIGMLLSNGDPSGFVTGMTFGLFLSGISFFGIFFIGKFAKKVQKKIVTLFYRMESCGL